MHANGAWDVVIVGAGPGGSACARQLAAGGARVLLVDKFRFPREKTCGDALTPRALDALAEIGMLDKVRSAARRIERLEIFAPAGQRIDAALPGRTGLSDHGLTLRRSDLDELLRVGAVSRGAEFRGGLRVDRLSPDGRGVTIHATEEGRPVALRARAAVLATGAAIGPLVRSGLLPRRPTTMLAVRRYFRGKLEPADRLQFRFDGLPMPAYGWIFPVPGGETNVGAIVYPDRRRSAPAARRAYERFVDAAPVRALLSATRAVEPLRGYPLRCDFPTAPTYGPRTLLLGEAAGLVNPLTGEGIDYALESGRVAAEELGGMLRDDDLSVARLESYDRRLRRRYQRLFVLSNRIRDLALNRTVLNRLISVAARRVDLKRLLVDVLQGRKEPDEIVSPRAILRSVLAG